MVVGVSDAHFDPLVHVAQPDHPDDVGEARAEAGRAIRDIAHALVGHHVPLELLEELTTTLDDLDPGLREIATHWEVRLDQDGSHLVAGRVSGAAT